MGRKIPAKKHRGIKDPLEQQARRLHRLQGKINLAPRDPDEQPAPRSLLRLLAPPAPCKQRRTPHTPGVEAGGAEGGGVRDMRRLAGEPARDFSRRIAGAVRALHEPAGGLDYHDLDEEDAEDVRGERMSALRERRARARRRAGLPASGPAGAPRPRRAQRRALKLKEKRALAAESARAAAAGAPVYERVRFGDTAHAPPALSAPRAAARNLGPRRGLLLSAVMAPPPPAAAPRAAPSPAPTAPPPAERARLAAVAAYRALKAGRRAPQPD